MSRPVHIQDTQNSIIGKGEWTWNPTPNQHATDSCWRKKNQFSPRVWQTPGQAPWSEVVNQCKTDSVGLESFFFYVCLFWLVCLFVFLVWFQRKRKNIKLGRRGGSERSWKGRIWSRYMKHLKTGEKMERDINQNVLYTSTKIVK